MIIRSTLDVDQQEGTSDLASAAAVTANGQAIAYESAMRTLGWHCPQRQHFLAVARVVGSLRARTKALQVRVVGITPNLFALGLYSKGQDTHGNPAAIALVELDSEGTALSAERWILGGARLSKIFDSHKDDILPEGWLQMVSDSWHRVSLLAALPGENGGNPRSSPRPGRRPNKSMGQATKPQPKQSSQKVAQAPAPGSRRERKRIQEQIKTAS